MRNGMYVVYGDQNKPALYQLEAEAVDTQGNRRPLTGLTAALREGEVRVETAFLHLLNPDGTTYTVLPAALVGTLRQAKIEEIPLARRRHYPEAALLQAGYTHL